jgi:O-antigen ligase
MKAGALTSKPSTTDDTDKKTALLQQCEIVLCMALALALHTSLTASWVILLLGFLITAMLPDLAGRFKRLIRAPLTVPLIVFALAVSLSALVNGGLADAMQIFSYLRSFIIYFYIYQAFATAHDGCEEKTLAVFLGIGAIAGLYGTIQQVFNFHPGTYRYMQATGFLQAPMPFAGLMQMTSFLALGLYLEKGYNVLPGPLKDKRFFGAILLANFMGLFFSCERSAWLGMAAGIVAITLRLRPQALIKVALALLAAVAIGWYFFPAVKARLSPLAHPEKDVGVSARLKIWRRAGDIFVSHPILGVGPAHFPSITDIPEALVPGKSTDLNHAHSNYMQILSTLGMTGFLAFLAILFVSLFVALKQSKDGGWSGGVGLGTFAALVSLMVAGVFEYNFGAGQVKLAQWFLIGALRNESPEGDENDN